MHTDAITKLRRGLLWAVLIAALLPMFAAAPDTTPASEQAELAQALPPATQPGSAASALPSGASVAIIRVEGMIYDFTLESLQRRVDRAIASGASIIVIELHTNGGTVDAGMAISKYIKTLPVPTVAWVNNKAYSAGILIASACDELVMAPASATGDCAPIVPGTELAPTERAKALSPILEEFRDNATANGYDYALFQAMCVLGVEVYQIENIKTGDRRLVNQLDYAVMVQGKSTDEVSPPTSGDPDPGAASLNIASDADRGQWRLVQKIHDGNTLLTLNQTRAMEAGLSDATVGSEAELARHLGAASTARIDQSWSENMVGFLVHPVVRGILVIALMLGAYVEFQTPGVGIAGAVAVLALLTLLGAPFLVGLAEVWHIIVFFIGFVLLVIELAFVPGFGLLGVAGLVLMFIGLVLSAIPTGGGSGVGPIRLPAAQMWDRLLASTFYMLAGIFISFVGFYFLTRYFGSLPLLSRLVLADQPVLAAANADGSSTLLHASGDEVFGQGRLKVGDTGKVTTGLHPSGMAEFGGQVIDVVSLGQWIEQGQAVRIVEIHGNRIVVELA